MKCETPARSVFSSRDPDAFFVRPPRVAEATESASQLGLPTALVGYTVLRLAQTARSALFVVGLVVAFALIAQISH